MSSDSLGNGRARPGTWGPMARQCAISQGTLKSGCLIWLIAFPVLIPLALIRKHTEGKQS